VASMTSADDDRGREPDERLDAGDLTEDPRLDSEALCLCGVLWSTATTAGPVVEVLAAGDFTRPAPAAAARRSG
jgi:hypothetical protein